MELGNLIFGYARGEWPIPRTDDYEIPIYDLIEALGDFGSYGTEYENDTFSMFPYYWGDCDCEETIQQDEKSPNISHKEGCVMARPNFYYKPTEVSVEWYKYALRDSYANREVKPDEWRKIMSECIKSVKNDETWIAI